MATYQEVERVWLQPCFFLSRRYLRSSGKFPPSSPAPLCRTDSVISEYLSAKCECVRTRFSYCRFASSWAAIYVFPNVCPDFSSMAASPLAEPVQVWDHPRASAVHPSAASELHAKYVGLTFSCAVATRRSPFSPLSALADDSSAHSRPAQRLKA
jgi:hypothetical protein